MRILVNGFGRMGRLFVRAAIARGLPVAAVHEPKGTPESLALLLEFDSVQGRWDRAVRAVDGGFLVGDRVVGLEQAGDPVRALGGRSFDLLVECSGKTKTRESLRPWFDLGVPRVLVSNPVPSSRNLVVGVNDAEVDFAAETVVTAASCTTNCLAPLVRVVHDHFGIERGLVTTIHDPTNTQGVVDRADADPRRARSALLNLIPTTTNSATAVAEIVPELAGRLDCIAVRAPVLNASLTDCSFQVARPTTVAEVARALQRAAEVGPLRGILGYETRPLVSSDYARDARSAVVDAQCLRVVDGTMVKVMAWYDNEWGYVNRMVDLALRFRAATE